MNYEAIQKAFAMLISDKQGDRESGAHGMHRLMSQDGKHPSDFKVINAKDAPRSLDDAIAAVRAECQEVYAERLDAARDGARAAREHAARLLKEKAALEEKLKRARAKPPTTHPYADDGKHETKLTAKLTGDAVFNLALDVIVARITALDHEQTRRSGNMTAEIDLPRGEFVAALHKKYEDEYGKRKRGSNAPTLAAFITKHVSKSADWCGVCFKAYLIVVSDDWPEIERQWDGTGGVRAIIRAAKEYAGRPVTPRRSKLQRRHDALSDAVRAKAWQDAAAMVAEWDAKP